MKKVFGFIIVTLCLPTIWWIGTNIRAELSTAQAHEQQIQKKIEVPEVQVQLPVTLVDQNGTKPLVRNMSNGDNL